MSIRAVVFDFGGVLFDWNPEYLYRKLIPDEAERRFFLSQVCNGAWNLQQDAGRSFAEGEAALIAEYPQYAELIRAWYARWPETLAGLLPEGVALMDRLEAAGIPLYGLTNWSAETWPHAWTHYPLLRRFRDIVVSGQERLIKPDPAIYALMQSRIARQQPGITAAELVFIDDSHSNAEGARRVGWHAIHHRNAQDTEAQLKALGLEF